MSFSLADTMSAMVKNTAALEMEPVPSAMEATQQVGTCVCVVMR
jgi:hypothetical protein